MGSDKERGTKVVKLDKEAAASLEWREQWLAEDRKPTPGPAQGSKR